MSWWMWSLNLTGFLLLIYLFYSMDKKWSSRPFFACSTAHLCPGIC